MQTVTACILEAISSTSLREYSYWYRSLSKIHQAASYCKGWFISRKYAHPTNQNNR